MSKVFYVRNQFQEFSILSSAPQICLPISFPYRNKICLGLRNRPRRTSCYRSIQRVLNDRREIDLRIFFSSFLCSELDEGFYARSDIETENREINFKAHKKLFSDPIPHFFLSEVSISLPILQSNPPMPRSCLWPLKPFFT